MSNFSAGIDEARAPRGPVATPTQRAKFEAPEETYWTSRYWIFVAGPDSFGVVALTPQVATSLNRLLKRYPEGTRFTQGDEPLFFVKSSNAFQVRIALRMKSDKAPWFK